MLYSIFDGAIFYIGTYSVLGVKPILGCLVGCISRRDLALRALHRNSPGLNLRDIISEIICEIWSPISASFWQLSAVQYDVMTTSLKLNSDGHDELYRLTILFTHPYRRRVSSPRPALISVPSTYPTTHQHRARPRGSTSRH